VKYALRRLGSRIRAVDGSHCHLLLPRQGLAGEERVAAVLEALRAADLRVPGASERRSEPPRGASAPPSLTDARRSRGGPRELPGVGPPS
jgi:hypothetical protein